MYDILILNIIVYFLHKLSIPYLICDLTYKVAISASTFSSLLHGTHLVAQIRSFAYEAHDFISGYI